MKSCLAWFTFCLVKCTKNVAIIIVDTNFQSNFNPTIYRPEFFLFSWLLGNNEREKKIRQFCTKSEIKLIQYSFFLVVYFIVVIVVFAIVAHFNLFRIVNSLPSANYIEWKSRDVMTTNGHHNVKCRYEQGEEKTCERNNMGRKNSFKTNLNLYTYQHIYGYQ